MKSNAGDKAYFVFLAEMYNLDPEDKLELEEHVFLKRATCVTHLETRRSFTAHRRVHGCELDYLDADCKLVEEIIEDPLIAAKRALAFLNRKTDRI